MFPSDIPHDNRTKFRRRGEISRGKIVSRNIIASAIEILFPGMPYVNVAEQKGLRWIFFKVLSPSKDPHNRALVCSFLRSSLSLLFFFFFCFSFIFIFLHFGGFFFLSRESAGIFFTLRGRRRFLLFCLSTIILFCLSMP